MVASSAASTATAWVRSRNPARRERSLEQTIRAKPCLASSVATRCSVVGSRWLCITATAAVSKPSRRAARIEVSSAVSSSGRTSRPSAASRAGIGKIACGSGRRGAIAKAKRSRRVWSPIAWRSSNPAVTKSATRPTRRSSRAFVPRVVAIRRSIDAVIDCGLSATAIAIASRGAEQPASISTSRSSSRSQASGIASRTTMPSSSTETTCAEPCESDTRAPHRTHGGGGGSITRRRRCESDDPSIDSSRPRSRPLLRTLMRRRSPLGETARQSVNVPPVSIVIRQGRAASAEVLSAAWLVARSGTGRSVSASSSWIGRIPWIDANPRAAAADHAGMFEPTLLVRPRSGADR